MINRMWGAITGVVCLVSARPAAAQFDMKAMASMDGDCRGEIAGQAVSCQPVGTFIEFGNGRYLVLFSRSGTLYGFSGDHLEARSDNSFALIVTMIRRGSQSKPEDDLPGSEGECLVQTNGTKSFAAIDCTARNRPQNLAYRFSLANITNFNLRRYE